MREFSWDIDYVLSLSFPVFLYLTSIIKRIRADYAVDTFFTAYVAAKTGKSAVDNLFKTAGSFFLDSPHQESAEPITPEKLKAAESWLERIIEERERKLEQAAL